MASIVFWTPNYEPELIGIAPLVTDAADWLTARGHGVEVVTAMPNYPERLVHDAYRKKLSVDEWIRGLSVHRTWLRVRPGESFLDKALYERPSPRPRRARLCAARSATTSWSAWCRRSPPQRSPRLHIARHGSCSWVQDLVAPLTRTVPGAARVRRRPRSSGSRPGPPARADRVVVCSVGFRDLLTASGVDNDRVVTVPNWVDTELVSPGEPPSAGRIHFLYAGNIGYTQGLETLVAAARDLDADVEIVGARNATADVRLAAAGCRMSASARPSHATSSRRCSTRHTCSS
jgi:colanic acid biosynthesis glycosyl transferase WcaI